MAENQASQPRTQIQSQDKLHFQYDHTDSCRFSRWTARECHDFMYARPWQKVNDFYSDMVNGSSSLSGLFREKKTSSNTHAINEDDETIENCNKSDLVSISSDNRGGRWDRVTFKIILSYHGNSFDGWQRQPNLNTVQGLIEQSLGKFVDDQKAQQLKDRSLPLEGTVLVAGRTDKGVSAFKQVISFYTWRKDVSAQDVKDAISVVKPGKIRVISVNKVSRDFHPNFSAKWRHYMYIFPLNNEADENKTIHSETNDKGEQESNTKPASFEVTKVNQLLNQLEGKLLSYKLFARDTKASRSDGPPTECFVFHARAAEASLYGDDGKHTKIMCIELVANRFLRKMVRVLVASAVREAAAGAEEDALLKLMDATCRRATAPPAPPDGLCLVGVGYTDFDKTDCLIA